jgi:3-oxoacyl-[acyl-carrier protein] reductase
MDLHLGTRTALITGSYRGTGAGIARCLAAEGATVLVHELEPGQARSVAEEIQASGGRADVVTGDPRSEAGAAALLREVTAAGREIDILVNNYGAAGGSGWEDGSIDDWTSMYETNVLSGVRLTRGLAFAMKARGFGRVVFLGTVGIARPRAQTPGYYAAKAALTATTVSLAKELSGSGVTVNLVSPGLVATPEVRALLERRARKRGWEGSFDEIESRAASDFLPTPSGRIARPDDVGALVAFLCSPWAASINASEIRIDGGAADGI